MKLIKKIDTVFTRTIEILPGIAGGLLGFMLFSVSINVFTRYFFDYSILWVEEISSYILLYLGFLTAAWVLKLEGHTTMDLVTNHLSLKAQAMLNLVTSLISALVCFIMAWYGLKVTIDLYVTKFFNPSMLHPPKYIIIAVIFFGSFLLAVQFIKRGYGYLEKWKGIDRGKNTQTEKESSEGMV